VRCDRGSVETGQNAAPDGIREKLQAGDVASLFAHMRDLPDWPADGLQRFCQAVIQAADNAKSRAAAIELLTMLHDRRFATGDKRRATVVQVIEQSIDQLFDSAPLFGEPATRFWRRITFATRGQVAAPQAGEELLLVDSQGFPPEGDDCDAVLLDKAHQLGWKRFAVYRLRGQRFHGAGLGPATEGIPAGSLRLERRLHRQRHGRPGDSHTRQRAGPSGSNRQSAASWSSTAT